MWKILRVKRFFTSLRENSVEQEGEPHARTKYTCRGERKRTRSW